jgi:GTP pyrophosphokinase
VKPREQLDDLNALGFDLESWVGRLCAADPRLEADALLRGCHLVASIPGHGQSLLLVGTEFAQLMAEMRIDTSCVVAALVYRAVNGRHLPLTAVRDALGEDAAHLVGEVQKFARVSVLELATAPLQQRQARDQLENVRLMLVAMIDDVRVAVLKLAERIVALRLLKRSTPTRQQRAAREVLAVFAPLANRLGIWRLKWELEDLAFRYESPEQYRSVAVNLAARRAEREVEVERIAGMVKTLLAQEGIRAEVRGRAKHIYSIVRKMRLKGVPLEGIHDIRAVRVIVDSLRDCYAALGVLHSHWHHVPLEFDDYIANPKENGYRSIHTAVVGPDERTLEVQIRTAEMHREAEFGVCSHWVYKDGSGRREGLYGEKLEWLRQVLEWHEEVGGFMSLGRELRTGIEESRIFVLTPGGHVIDLTAGSTPVDFAYRIHTDIGHRCVGAIVDGRDVPLETPLETGQRVEIVTGDRMRPDRAWLDPGLGYVRTARARAKIQAWFRAQGREVNAAAGRELFVREVERLGLEADGLRASRSLGYPDEDAMYSALAIGERSLAEIAGVLDRHAATTAAGPRNFTLRLTAADRPGLLHDVTAVIAACGATMSRLVADSEPAARTATIRLSLDLAGIEALASVVDGIARIPGIVDVRRLTSG